MEARKVTAKNMIMRDLGTGEVAVFATPEEWRQVIDALGTLHREDAAPKLVYWLINQGVYDR